MFYYNETSIDCFYLLQIFGIEVDTRRGKAIAFSSWKSTNTSVFIRWMKNSRNNTITVNRKLGKTTVREVSTELRFRGSPVSCWAVKMNAITKRSPPICWFYWASALRTMCNNLLAIRLNIWAVSTPQHGSLNMNNSGGSRVLGPLLLILSTVQLCLQIYSRRWATLLPG